MTFDLATALFDRRNGETHIISHLAQAAYSAIASGNGSEPDIERALRAWYDIDESAPGADFGRDLNIALNDLLRIRLIQRLQD